MTEIDFDHPPADPITQVQRWVDEATEQTDLPNPSAMTLATVDGDGRPSARVVLLRGLDERGAVFYTNYESRKGADLVGNPRAALVMHWDALERQVRMEGTVTKTSDEESDAYFAQRPLTSQLGAWASEQSKPLASRADLEAQVEVYIRRFIDGHVPRPPHWGGYRVKLDRIELWQGRVHRLHDRIEYVRDGDVWVVRRLCP